MKPLVVAAIFARGGSKGVPGKNIKSLAGKPLIAYAIQTAKAVDGIDAVIVSTDDARIADVARQWGAQVPFMRPAHLATDDSPEILSWQHALEIYGAKAGRKIDVLVSVPTTSPLREPADVAGCLKELLSTDADAVITVTTARRNPYYNMVQLDKAGYARLVVQGHDISGRQKAPVVYDMTTVCYAVRADFILAGHGIFDGKLRAVTVPPERALDIDTPLDFEFAEFLMQRKVHL